MTVTDFTIKEIAEASELALKNYGYERIYTHSLPEIMPDDLPNLAPFAENGLGAAAFEGGRLAGFLGVYPPFDNAFRSTKARGVFSPMGASASVLDNRAKIYAALYQHAGRKWAEAGASSHAVCLYAHDTEALSQFFRYGFGMRCVDAIRMTEDIVCPACEGYTFAELEPSEFSKLYELEIRHTDHYRHSPIFMNRINVSIDGFIRANAEEDARFFVALCGGEICAFMRVTAYGETFVTYRPDSRHITGAYCLPEHRGKGVYANLLDYVITVMRSGGYTRLGVDFESINPNAWGFWLKYFSAYTYGVVRRIDENVLKNV